MRFDDLGDIELAGPAGRDPPTDSLAALEAGRLTAPDEPNALALFKSWGEQENSLSITPVGEQQGVSSDRLFDEMLSHLYLPLVNLNNFLKGALESRADHASGDLATSVVQLKTKAEVLQFAFDRLISEMMLEKYTRTDTEQVAERLPLTLTDQSSGQLRA